MLQEQQRSGGPLANQSVNQDKQSVHFNSSAAPRERLIGGLQLDESIGFTTVQIRRDLDSLKLQDVESFRIKVWCLEPCGSLFKLRYCDKSKANIIVGNFIPAPAHIEVLSRADENEVRKMGSQGRS